MQREGCLHPRSTSMSEGASLWPVAQSSVRGSPRAASGPGQLLASAMTLCFFFSRSTRDIALTLCGICRRTGYEPGATVRIAYSCQPSSIAIRVTACGQCTHVCRSVLRDT